MVKILVIFDIDGTLVSSNRVDSQCFATTFEELYQKPFPTIDWRKYPHVTDTTIFNTVLNKYFNRHATEREIAPFLNRFLDLLHEKRRSEPHQFNEVPRAKETVETLKKTEGFEVAIATGGWGKPAKLKLSHVDIDYSDLVLSSADGKVTREAIIEEAVEKSFQRWGRAERIVYVGDAVWDVQTTKRMQMNFVGIRIKGDFEVLQQEGATHILKDYSNLEHFIECIEKAVPPAKVKKLF